MPKVVKILVIEDDQFLNKVYMNKLGQEGYVVLTAVDGLTGLEKARQEKPGLIVLDIILPKMNGFEVLQELKQDPTVKDIPVIIISNLGQNDDIKRGLDLGAEEYLVKTNYTIDDILKKIRDYIEGKKVKKVEVKESEIAQAQPAASLKPKEQMKEEVKDFSCSKCGNKVPPASNFCPICGNKL